MEESVGSHGLVVGPESDEEPPKRVPLLDGGVPPSQKVAKYLIAKCKKWGIEAPPPPSTPPTKKPRSIVRILTSTAPPVRLQTDTVRDDQGRRFQILDGRKGL